MTRRQRIWAATLAGVAVVVVLAVVLFDWNWFRPVAEARASAAVGRAVRIGNLGVELSRMPRILLDRVTVANPPEFPADSQMAEVERIAVRIDLMKLLRGQVSLPELSIEKPVARLEPGPSGQPNWRIEASGDTSAAPPQLGQVTITDGRVRLRHPARKADVDLKVHTEPDPKTGEALVVLTGTGRYAEAPTRIELRGGSLLSLREAKVGYPVHLQWQVGPTRIKLDGTVRNPANFAGLEGVLDLRGPDLDELFPLIGIPLPPSPPYHLAGKLTYADRRVRFENFNGTLGGSDLSGTLDVHTGGERWLLEGNLTSRKVRLVDLGGFLGAVPGKGDEPAATPRRKAEAQQAKASDRALPSTPIDVQKLNAIDARVTYRGQRIEDDYAPIDNLQAKLDLENGRLRLQPLDFGIGQGSIAMKLDLDARAAPPRIAVDTEFRNVDLRRIMQQTRMFEGAGRIGGRARLVSAGSNAAEILANGTGGLTLAQTGGQMSALLVELVGIDLAEALGIKVADRSKQYPIRCMVVDGELQKGVFQSKVIVIDTTDTNIVANAAIDFHNESLKARLEPHPKDVSILTFRTPVNIGGTLSIPR